MTFRRKTMAEVLASEPRVYPIPLRADVTVQLHNLPADLTPAEADKIAAVVRALATPAGPDRLNPEKDG